MLYLHGQVISVLRLGLEYIDVPVFAEAKVVNIDGQVVVFKLITLPLNINIFKKGMIMKTFSEFYQLMEARKMSKSTSQKWQRIECEDCERIYHIPKSEYDREVQRTGKWRQYPDEDCPYCRHENKMDPMPGQRRARHGDHTGYVD